MNQQEKVIQAIVAYEQSQQAALDAEVKVHEALHLQNEMKQNLVRVLHAVYGERAGDGVMLSKRIYRLEPENGDQHFLHVQHAEFEVLG